MVWGCSSNGFLMARPTVLIYGQVYPERKVDAKLDIFNASRPKVEFSEIAKISCGDTDDSWNLKQISMKARELGADAIILVGRSGSYGSTLSSGDFTYIVTDTYGLSAIAIKYKD